MGCRVGVLCPWQAAAAPALPPRVPPWSPPPDSDVPLWMDTWATHSFTGKGAHGHQLHTSQARDTQQLPHPQLIGSD